MGKKEELVRTFQKQASESDIRKIDHHLANMNKGKIKDIWPKIQALYQMIKDPKAAWSSKAMAIGALLYLVSPMDAVPDIIPVAGLADDAAIIIATVSTLAVQLKKYMVEFEEEKAVIQKAVLFEVEDRKTELKIDAKKQEEEVKQKFILKVVTIIGIFATIITLIVKFG
ncbi:DUF1232 domain-containing protein [Lutibacter sp. B2]|nr:DUF1232 domain-containing protein [Lutibacter sp. B2]